MTTDTKAVDIPSESQTVRPSPDEDHGPVTAEAWQMSRLARCLATPVVRLSLHFLEMQIPMVLGAFVCYLLGRLIPASSSFATAYYHPGTYLYTTGDCLFLTVPVVAWMIFRGDGWRHSLEMAIAMLAPVAAIIVLGQLAGHAYLLWLVTAMYPAMCLGMLVYMLYRPDHFTGQACQTEHGSHGTTSAMSGHWALDHRARMPDTQTDQ